MNPITRNTVSESVTDSRGFNDAHLQQFKVLQEPRGIPSDVFPPTTGGSNFVTAPFDNLGVSPRCAGSILKPLRRIDENVCRRLRTCGTRVNLASRGSSFLGDLVAKLFTAAWLFSTCRPQPMGCKLGPHPFLLWRSLTVGGSHRRNTAERETKQVQNRAMNYAPF